MPQPPDSAESRWDQLDGLVPYLERLRRALLDLDLDDATMQVTQGLGIGDTTSFLARVNHTLQVQSHAPWEVVRGSWSALVATGRDFLGAFQRGLDYYTVENGNSGLSVVAFGAVIDRFNELLDLFCRAYLQEGINAIAYLLDLARRPGTEDISAPMLTDIRDEMRSSISLSGAALQDAIGICVQMLREFVAGTSKRLLRHHRRDLNVRSFLDWHRDWSFHAEWTSPHSFDS